MRCFRAHKRKAMNPRASTIIAIVVFLTAGTVGCQPMQQDDGRSGRAHAGESGFTRVERVIDGDTVVLSRSLGTARVVGVDTPETARPHTPVECFGPEASAFTERVLGAAGTVRYRVALEPVDRYGRGLVYLWLSDGRLFNAMLVRGGYARPLAFPRNTHYATVFQRLADEAARHERGLWGYC